MDKKDIKEFWVHNITDTDISLGDLRVTVKSRQSKNLLGVKSLLTVDQLLKSAESGSLFKRKDKIKITYETPNFNKPKPKYTNSTQFKLSSYPQYSNKKVEKEYEELDLPDEKFADEFSDD
jgi:hypothetical protein